MSPRIIDASQREVVVPKLDLPYLGPVAADVLLFVGTSLAFRIYQFWRRRVSDKGVSPDDDERPRNRQIKSQREDEKTVHKAKSYKGHKDPGLYELIDQCKETRRSLRKVGDPEVNRKKKTKELRKSNNGGSYLGMSPDSLEQKRQALRSTPSNQNKALNNY
jgi:hypothetical protein